MKLIYAGIIPAPEQNEWKMNKRQRLFSYFDCMPHNRMHRLIEETMMKRTVKLFLDSGAFSAKTQGITIDVHEYIKFILEHEKYIEVYANLDVIGDAKASWKNQRIMEDAGLNPLPVFHVEDDIKYLHKCMENYDHFCVGGMATGFTTEQRTRFLDKVWSIICDTKDRKPAHKVHGFGMTSLRLMLRYPWWSVDSTSWVVTGRMGSVYVPRFRKGEWLYDENSWKVAVSNRSPSQSDAGQHLSTFSPRVREIILDYIHDKGYKVGSSEFRKEKDTYKLQEDEKWFGKALGNGKREVEKIIEVGLCNDYKLRDELNIIYFLDLEKNIPKWPWAFEQQAHEDYGFGL